MSFVMFSSAKIGTLIYIASDLSKTLSLFNNKSCAILFIVNEVIDLWPEVSIEDEDMLFYIN